ncbi:HupE/UreJ family protein [soil metagenome]
MRRLLVLLAMLSASAAVLAHEVRPAYLQIRETTPDTYDVLWKVPGYADEFRLGLYVEFPADVVALGAPRGEFSGGSFSERWSVHRPGGLTGATIRIDGLANTLTDVLVRLERRDGTVQTLRLAPAAPSFIVEAAPGRLEVTGTYLKLGIEHILLGIDHLLFVLALLILVRGTRRLVATVTAFTVAHSITLAAATLGVIHVPGPPVEACIALSIAFVAAEIVQGARGRPGLTAQKPWLVAFAFGLLHGLGFASALSDVGLPQAAIPVALLFFNVGVEIGQLLFIAGTLALIQLARVRSSPAFNVASAYVIGAVAAFWTVERTLSFLS